MRRLFPTNDVFLKDLSQDQAKLNFFFPNDENF